MATASLTNLPRPLAAALKHNVSPSPVRVVRREDTGGAVARSLRLRCSLTTTYGSYQIGGPGPEVEFEMEPTAHLSSLNDVAFDISLSVQESFMYVKPEALLLACEAAAAAAAAMPFQASWVLDKRCAICIEDLPVPGEGGGAAGDPAFTLPSCSHTFHRGCMASWFEKRSTCPLCRHDMIGCLTDMEKQFVIR